VLDRHGALSEAYCLTVDILAMAAVTLLAVLIAVPDYVDWVTLKETSNIAEKLLQSLAQRNRAAGRCLGSLNVSRCPEKIRIVAEERKSFELTRYYSRCMITFGR
jgi:hypothetical protein